MDRQGAIGWNAALRVCAILMIILALSPPINKPISFALLFFLVLVVVFGEIRPGRIRWPLALVLVMLSTLVVSTIPTSRIVERHNLFLHISEGEPIQRALPKQVYAEMAAGFEQHYPLARRCDATKYGCWAFFGVPKSGFAWSGDRAFGEPSRIVSNIDFHDLASFRLGEINEIQYNWYSFPTQADTGFSEIKRESAPFFVEYTFPPDLVGSSLCIRGTSFWKEGAADWKKISDDNKYCRQIVSRETRVFAFSFDPTKPLSMRLEKTPSRLAWDWLAVALRLICAMSIPLILVRLPVSVLVPVAIGGSSLLAVYCVYPTLFSDFRVHYGGNDGLTHEGFGRIILRAAISGNWRDALQGVEPVFYFMPGLRYFRALERIVFGDTNYGYVMAIASIPIAIFCLLREFVPTKVAVAIVAIFIVSAPFPSMAMGYFPYIQSAEWGYPDTLGYLLFLVGMIYGFKTTRWPSENLFAWISGVAFALAVFLRPNLVIGGGVFLSLLGIFLIRERRWVPLCYLAIGVAPSLLITVHNWVFGGRFVLLTSAAFIKENLFLTPGQYASAIGSILGLGDRADLVFVGDHLKAWLKILPGHAYWHPLILLILTVSVCLGTKQPWRIRVLIATALSLHSVLWFWHPDGRYALLAWTLTAIAGIGGYVSWRQSRATSQAISSVREEDAAYRVS